jgi:hypothetical protein
MEITSSIVSNFCVRPTTSFSVSLMRSWRYFLRASNSLTFWAFSVSWGLGFGGSIGGFRVGCLWIGFALVVRIWILVPRCFTVVIPTSAPFVVSVYCYFLFGKKWLTFTGRLEAGPVCRIEDRGLALGFGVYV